MRSRPVIAIDGPAGAGKSTVARHLAERLGYRFLDTGALYRAVALLALRRGLDPGDEEGIAALARAARIELVPGAAGGGVLLDGVDVSEEIRGPAASSAVSTVAALPAVREAVKHLQQEVVAADDGCAGVVAEGRDIGTVVFPDAEVKFYLDADPGVRAARRAAERGEGDVARVAAEISDRDRRDRGRAVAPLRPAADAICVECSDLGVDQVVDLLERTVRNARGPDLPA